MTIAKEFIEKFINVTSEAALASYYLVGKKNKMAADKAGKAGFTGTSKAITGASKKVHSGSRQVGKFVKKNPKLSSFAGGMATISFLDD